LNPNVPWKTRGNGAVCLQLTDQNQTMTEGRWTETTIGQFVNGTPCKSYTQISQLNNNEQPEITEESEIILERIEHIITSKAALDDETTNPGIVFTPDVGLPIDLYWSAVHEIVDLDELKARLKSLDVMYKGFKSGRGIIGASAAIAWAANRIAQEMLDHTYELITYRLPENIGTQRKIDPNVVKEIENKYPSTFNNYDFENDHVAIAPNSPCPVLFGVRGDDPNELYKVLDFLKPNSESIERWLLFDTNQGTDDHLKLTTIPEIKPYTSVITTGRVSNIPSSIIGGHVIFSLEELNQNSKKLKISCAAYEPTKNFREIIRKFLPGDIISVYGGVRAEPKSINIEKIDIHQLVKNIIKTSNPHCPNCGHMMKSKGRGLGYRCRNSDCNSHKVIKSDDMASVETPRYLSIGKYEVPVSARRHLSKPLKRFENYTGQSKILPKSL
jgi:tRNA(Ile2)-agmatinylcytidine synthase